MYKDNSRYLKECFLQKTNQFECLRIKRFCPDAIKIGSELQLEIEKEENAAKGKVVAKTMGNDPAVIGVLSEEDEKEIRQYLEMGWKEIYLCRISKRDFKAEEDKRLSVAIFIRNK